MSPAWLNRNATGQPQWHAVSLLCCMLFKPAIDGTTASTVLVLSGRHYSHYQNEMPFGRGTRMVSSNIVLNRGLSLGKGRFRRSNPPFLQQCHLLPKKLAVVWYQVVIKRECARTRELSRAVLTLTLSLTITPISQNKFSKCSKSKDNPA